MAYSYHKCEPCGECAWCRQRHAWHREVIRLRAQRRRTHKLLAEMEVVFTQAIHGATDSSEERGHYDFAEISVDCLRTLLRRIAKVTGT